MPIPLDSDYIPTREWISQAIAWWFNQDGAPDGDTILANVTTLPSEQLKLPVVQLLLGMLKLEINGRNQDDGTLLAAWKRLPESSDVPAALVWTASIVQNKLGSYNPKLHPTEFSKVGVRALVRALRKECYYEEDKWLALTLPERGMRLNVAYDDTENYETILSEVPAAIRDLLLGEVEIERAWGARGGGFAYKVTPEGWKGFAKHLANARVLLMRAFDAAPTQPLTASRMLPVCQGQGSSPEETRLWLDRALAAQRDHFDAWVQYMNLNLTRWGGSSETLQTISLEVARQIDWNSDLPLIFEKSLEFLVEDTDELRSTLLHEKTMEKAFLLYLASIPPAPPESAASVWKRGNLFAFINSCHARQYGEARTVLDRVGSDALAGMYRKLNGRSAYSFASLRADILARSGMTGQRFLIAESAQASGKAGQAARIFSELADTEKDPPTQDWLRHHALCAAFESAWIGSGSTVTPVDAAPLGPVQGVLIAENDASCLKAGGNESATAVLWLSSKTSWELSVTFDTGDQPEATTGVFWGTSQRGDGLAIGSPNGWGDRLLSIPFQQLTHDEPAHQDGDIPGTTQRDFTMRWDGRFLSVSGKAGSKTWTKEALAIEAKPGVWMLALTARSKAGPLKATVLRNFILKPLPAGTSIRK